MGYPELWVLHRNVLRFRGRLVFKAHRLRVSLNSRRKSNKEEEKSCRRPASSNIQAKREKLKGFYLKDKARIWP